MRLAALARKRAIYIGRLLYWCAAHGSVDRARWVLDYEGIEWN